MTEITLELMGSNDFERCECCGDNSRTVWGLIYLDGYAHASYFVHWTLGKVETLGAHLDLILGAWGEGTTKADRYAVSLEYRLTDQGPGFMVIDATTHDSSQHELAGHRLLRDEVVGTALSERVFELVDAISLQDIRIKELSGANRV